jgi:hypothetical protein
LFCGAVLRFRALGFVSSFPEKSTVKLWEEKKMNAKIDEKNLRDAEVRGYHQ